MIALYDRFTHVGDLAQPAKAPRVLVIHENRGLTDQIRDVARRLASDGLVALAADFLLPMGGTPTLAALKA